MIKKIINLISTVLLLFVVAIAVMLVGVRVVGYTPYTILSGSMNPKYQRGDLVYVKETDPLQIQKGDVLTFKISDSKIVTHRVFDVDRENRCFYTKGDANDIVDGASVPYENVIGTVSFSMPKLGYISTFLTTQKGKFIAIMIFCIIILLFVLPEFFFRKSKTL